MRALLVERYTEIEALELCDVPSPRVEPGGVRVRLRAVGIGFVDSLKIGGRYQTKDPLPFVPGTEFAGVVGEVGDGVPSTRVGERVFGRVARGGLAEEICVPAATLSRMPDHLSFAQAAAVPVNYLTAAYALVELADLKPGQHLLILGAAGGTGTAAIKIARMRGARVFAAAASESKRLFALEQGADLAIDYTAPDWRKTLMSMTGGRPMDVVFDTIGGDVSPTAFRTLGWRGKHLVIGFASGSIAALPMNIALLKGASLVGVDCAQIQKWEAETYTRLVDNIASWLEARALDPPPVMIFRFEDFREAFGAIGARRATGKVVVEM
jgi:NADPH:quinone reductase